MNTYTICDSPLQRSARRSLAPSQKSRQNHRPNVWTEALSGVVYVPGQKLCGMVIVLNTLCRFFGVPVAFCAREVLREISAFVDVKSRTTIIIGVFSWMSFPRIIRKFCLNDFRKRTVQLKRYISRHSLRHTFSAVQAKKVPCKF